MTQLKNINSLASRVIQRVNKGLDKLDYDKNVYASRSDKYNIKAISDFNSEYNSYTKYKKASCKNFYMGDKIKYFQIGDNSSINRENIGMNSKN